MWTYTPHLARIMAREILEGSPSPSSVLGKDEKVLWAGPSSAIWNLGKDIVFCSFFRYGTFFSNNKSSGGRDGWLDSRTEMRG